MVDDGDLEEIIPEDEVPRYVQDWWLELLVRMANKGAFSVSITLYVGGTLVSGELVSGPEYFKHSAELVSSFAADSEAADIVRDALSKPAEAYDDIPDDERPTFIHLRDAIPWSPTGSSINRAAGSWWRGRLAAVDGWQYGRYESE